MDGALMWGEERNHHGTIVFVSLSWEHLVAYQAMQIGSTNGYVSV